MRDTRVLVCEDEVLVAREIEVTLQDFGYRVVGIAHNKNEALDTANKNDFDIALIDIMFNDEPDGIMLAHELSKRHDVPVIFLTACSDRATVEYASTIRPVGFVVKPFHGKQLHAAIQNALQQLSPSTSMINNMPSLNEILDVRSISEGTSKGGISEGSISKDLLETLYDPRLFGLL